MANIILKSAKAFLPVLVILFCLFRASNGGGTGLHPDSPIQIKFPNIPEQFHKLKTWLTAKVAHNAKRLNILLVMASLEACQSHVHFVKLLANVLKKRHSVHLLLIKISREEVDFNAEGQEDSNLTIEPYVPKDEELLAILRDRTVKNSHVNFAKLYNSMTKDAELMARLKAKEFHVGITEFVFFTRTAPFLFHALGLKNIIYYNHAPNPQQLHDLGEEVWEKANRLPMSGRTNLNEFSTIYRSERKDMMLKLNQDYIAYAHDKEGELKDVDRWLREQSPSYPGTVELFHDAPLYLVNTVPEIEIDGGAALSAAVHEGHPKVVMMGGIHIKDGRKGRDKVFTRLEAFCAKLRAFVLKNAGTRLEQLWRDRCLPRQRLDAKIEAKAAAMGELKMEGIVLFTVGTAVKSETKIGADQFAALEEAIQNFPNLLFVVQLSKKDTERIERLNQVKNVHASSWVQQLHILADMRTKIFISHCGRHSQLEGLYFGKPMVCFPFQVDQPYNAEQLMANGLGTALDITFYKGKPLFTDPEDRIGNAEETSREQEKKAEDAEETPQTENKVEGKGEEKVEGTAVPVDVPRVGDEQRDFRFTAENVSLAILDALGWKTRHTDLEKVQAASQQMRGRNLETMLFDALDRLETY